ncbi:hypothetical protein DFH07DRAFT_851078 [Mycena maculata]|uniref:F-box domain-containing protein n=1 Tax=Mycena maculata TaxID=230809 RepID=A0AAD7HVZ1_9AGAR|nr:hypothetical protein DFH07DRAFT_851078 [Mycena maculata]
MIHAAPNLVECTLDCVDFAHEHWVPSPLVPHSGLRHLRIIYGSGYILRCLALPLLQHLTISNCDTALEHCLEFLNRSSPPLRSFGMRMYHGPPRMNIDATIERFLSLVPVITDLDLAFTDYSEDFIFSLILAIASPQCIPNLRNLTIRSWGLDCFNQWKLRYEQVLRMLSARRAIPHSQLHSFKFFWILAGMQRLVADGMEIYIGTQEKNFI